MGGRRKKEGERERRKKEGERGRRKIFTWEEGEEVGGSEERRGDMEDKRAGGEGGREKEGERGGRQNGGEGGRKRDPNLRCFFRQ